MIHNQDGGIMKRKKVVALTVAAALLVNGCSSMVKQTANNGCGKEGCTCECECCRGTVISESLQEDEEAIIVRDSEMMNLAESTEEGQITENSDLGSSETEEESTSLEGTASEATQQDTSGNEEESQQADNKKNEIAGLTEGEKQARRENQANYKKLRDSIYKQKNSKAKMDKINKVDKEIIANNSFDFSTKNIVFIGDSITEGITSSKDLSGMYISYVHYTDMYLNFNRTLNHGKGGRMFSVYGGEELSLCMNFDNVTNNESDIIVVFAGINDYIVEAENKRFGNPKDSLSSAGYCGTLRYFMKQLQEYYSDKEIFFVTPYNVERTSYATYSDYNGQPSLGDYVKVMKDMAAEYGFNVIDLYGTGFMDTTDDLIADVFLYDSLHPNDEGSRVLGEHIAAELSLYFSQK